MDPISAVSLAGTIVQFVSFAAKLIAVASDVHGSTSSISDDVENIETVYEKLEKFSADLANLKVKPGTQDGFATALPGDDEQSRAIRELSASCKNDCDRLLDIIRGLPTKRGPKTRRGSFQVALRLIRKSGEISSIDKRLQKTQASLTVHLCGLSNEFHRKQSEQYGKLEEICRQNYLRQHDQLQDIRRMLEKLAARFQAPAVYEAHDVACLQQQMSALSIATRYTDQQQQIIQSLGFSNRQVRHAKIPEAHIRTFRWAFEHSEEEEATGGRLLRWLQEGSGIFWVSGKPGSGKSTFMKYMADNERTREALKRWSGDKEVIVASHYFWIAGTEMQRSRHGLLQTLLFDIFRQYPQLVKAVCRPKRWAETEPTGFRADAWSVAELQECMELVKDQVDVPFNFCFFLDGLDEYDGDHLELCQDLRNLCQSPNIKICASSRPWNAFQDAFGGDNMPSLCIHNITRRDIEGYAESRLIGHPRWALLQEQTKTADTLVQEIIEKSKGVFLWVFLVTRMLREGLTNDDTFADLRKRLASFPSDLEKFFKHIIDSVDPFYHEKMATSLQITVKAKAQLDLLNYIFHYQEFDDEHYAINMPPRILSERQSEELRNKAVRYLNGYCRGLLERCENQVDFLHRTVADFLRTREMSDTLAAKCPRGFNPELSILRTHLAWIKRNSFYIPRRESPGRYEGGVKHDVCSALSYAHTLGEMTDGAASASFEILDDMESFICGPVARRRGDIHGEKRSVSASRLFFREMVVKADLPDYLATKLAENLQYFADFDCPALYVLLHSDVSGQKEREMPDPGTHYNTLKVLLENGQDPNELIKTPYEAVAVQTPWSVFMGRIATGDGFNSKWFNSCLKSGIFQLFLDNGADPNANAYYGPSDSRNSTACEDFVCIALDPQRRRSDDVSYLTALDSFLQHGASVAQGLLIASDDMGCEPELLTKFRDGKCDQLTVDIVVRLLFSLRELGQPGDINWQALGGIFKGKQFAEIQARYHSTTQGVVDGKGQEEGKRRHQCDGESQSRRSKWSRIS